MDPIKFNLEQKTKDVINCLNSIYLNTNRYINGNRVLTITEIDFFNLQFKFYHNYNFHDNQDVKTLNQVLLDLQALGLIKKFLIRTNKLRSMTTLAIFVA
jgi:hypothetical protein